MQTAIIYTRVSTEEQNEKGYSLADQEDKLRRFCQNKGIEIIQHFQDAHSAKTFDRPEFKNLLSFIKKIKGSLKNYWLLSGIDFPEIWKHHSL